MPHPANKKARTLSSKSLVGRSSRFHRRELCVSKKLIVESDDVKLRVFKLHLYHKISAECFQCRHSCGCEDPQWWIARTHSSFRSLPDSLRSFLVLDQAMPTWQASSNVLCALTMFCRPFYSAALGIWCARIVGQNWIVVRPAVVLWAV